MQQVTDQLQQGDTDKSSCLSLVHWNTDGWTISNCELRTLLLQFFTTGLSLAEVEFYLCSALLVLLRK